MEIWLSLKSAGKFGGFGMESKYLITWKMIPTEFVTCSSPFKFDSMRWVANINYHISHHTNVILIPFLIGAKFKEHPDNVTIAMHNAHSTEYFTYCPIIWCIMFPAMYEISENRIDLLAHVLLPFHFVRSLVLRFW